MSNPTFKTVTMQIPEELSHDIRRQVIAFMEQRQTELTAALEAVKETRKAMRASGKNASADATNGTAPAAKRASKEQVKRLILEDLGTLNGGGGLINEIALRLKVSYGTTHRAVVELLGEKKIAKGDDNRIRLAVKTAAEVLNLDE